MNGYHVYPRQWFSFAFENPDVVSGNHGIVYLWAVELNNRLGWVKKFGIPSEMAMAAAGIKSYKTYSKIFEDLVKWGFFEVHQKSMNQYTADVIALVNFTEAHTEADTEAPTGANTKALTDAILNQLPEQYHGSVGIIIPKDLKTDIPINQETVVDAERVDVEMDLGEVVQEIPEAPRKVAPKGSPKFNALEVQLPHGPDFANVWRDWVTHRREKKSPLTELSVKRQLELVSCYTEKIAIEIILTSITSGYQGLFPPKSNGNGKSGNRVQSDKQFQNVGVGGSGVSPRLESAFQLLAQHHAVDPG